VRLLSLTQRLTLISFVVLTMGVLISGWWVSRQIEAAVIHETAATMALYVNSFISPHLQELGRSRSFTPDNLNALNSLLQDTDLRDQIVGFLVWDVSSNHVLYSNIPSLIGHGPEEGEPGLPLARQGETSARISTLDDAENAVFGTRYTRLLETYIPVRLRGTDQIIAVVEFYQSVDDLEAEVAARQREGWLAVGATAAVIYLVLVGYVRWANRTIGRQRAVLRDQVTWLTDLLSQNEELHNRMHRAAGSVTELNEQWLRRISAELHDGPAQDIGLALLRLDRVIGHREEHPGEGANGNQYGEHLPSIQTSLNRALHELRQIARGLGLPELNGLTLADTVNRAVRAHEQRTGAQVALVVDLSDLPEQPPLPIKITTYRFIQEALNNAYRHAGGIGLQVRVRGDANQLSIEVIDQGPGFNADQIVQDDEHLGLAGMRERVESLGGSFCIESEINRGTKVSARLSLQAAESADER
jgi:signal transduction histidine kinase